MQKLHAVKQRVHPKQTLPTGDQRHMDQEIIWEYFSDVSVELFKRSLFFFLNLLLWMVWEEKMSWVELSTERFEAESGLLQNRISFKQDN